MWYRIKLGAADAGTTPLRTDRVVLEGPCLEDVVAEAAVQVVNAADQSRPSDHPKLRMLLFVGMEVEQWTSRSDYLRHDGEAEGFRHAMRDCVARCRSSSST